MFFAGASGSGALTGGLGFLGGRFGNRARFGFDVFLEAEVVGGLEGTGENIFGSGRQDDVSHAHAAPTTGNGKKYLGEFRDKGSLLLKSEHEVAITLLGGGEGGEDAAVDAEVGLAHMGGFLDVGEGERDAAEIVEIHRRTDGLRRLSRQG